MKIEKRTVCKIGSTTVCHKMVVVPDDQPFVLQNHPWVDDPSRIKEPLPTNCKNCGAPLHGSRCDYCGTEYGPEPMLIVKGQPADMDKLIDQLHKTGIVPVKSITEVTKL